MGYYKKDMIYKGYSRIFVRVQADMERVNEILKAIDLDEYEGYCPENLVTVWTEQEPLVYNGKFDLDIDRFYHECFKAGIPVYVVTKEQELYA